MPLPLGLQNNNPGNMRPTGDHWLGMTGENQGFLQFQSIVFGYRALIKNCINAIGAGYDTIEEFVTHYAPPTENDTKAYIDYVTKSVGLGKDAKLDKGEDTIKRLVYAISYHEQGVKPDQNEINAGWTLLTTGKIATAGGIGLLVILALIFVFK